MLIPKYGNCGTLGDWAKQQGLFHPYTETPQPGDIVLFDFTGKHTTRQHVGVLKSVSGATLTTVEGNTSVTSDDNGGAVMRRARYASQVVGYIRPAWTSTQTAAKLIAIAEAEIGTKESPAGSNNVKYNTWFYGKAVSGDWAAWCAVFVCWCFAVLAGEIGPGKDGDTEDETVTVTTKLLQNGSAGSAVQKLQILLNGLGYNCGTVDGAFGVRTRTAVLAFQKANSLDADGVVGSMTWGKLVN